MRVPRSAPKLCILGTTPSGPVDYTGGKASEQFGVVQFADCVQDAFGLESLHLCSYFAKSSLTVRSFRPSGSSNERESVYA